jgi:Cu(I)/Ag(I) efflux system membrane fusion protein
MKKFRFVILVSTMMFFAAACNSNSSRSDTKKSETEKSEQMKIAENNYTCPMHPEVLSDQPGNCPKCGMELVKADSVNVPLRDTL